MKEKNKRMKKTKLLLAVLASGALLVGCNNQKTQYFGFGGYAVYDNSPAPYVGHVQTEINYVAVVTDAKDKIVNLRLDTVQVNAKLVDGVIALTSTLKGTSGDIKSKWELLDDYNMKPSSEIEKEWYEQAQVFETWSVGKTLSEIKAKVDKHHKIEDGASLGVSIEVDQFVKALEVALDHKVEVKEKIHAIGVGGVNALSMAPPSYQVVKGHDYTVAGAAFSEDKKVLAARIDTFQLEYAKFASSGEEGAEPDKIKIDETKQQVVKNDTRIKGKQELGDAYGMKDAPANEIKKEWYEQIDALIALIKGKDVAATLGTGANLENGIDVGCTMDITNYRAALIEAQDTAFNSRVPA